MSDTPEIQEHSLDNTPVDVAIKALQYQVDQLKRIVNKTGPEDNSTDNESNEKELKEQIKALQIANEKAEYRIKFLLRTLEEKEIK